MVIDVPVEEKPKFIFARVREPDQFKPGTFRFMWFNRGRGIGAIVGILKSTGKSAIQAMRFLKVKGWTVEKAGAWVQDHRSELSFECDEMVRTVNFEELQEIFAKWDTKYVNDLPDAAFAVILPGGERDDGKTVPRSLRKLPHHTASVKDGDEKSSLDMPHLRNAIARLRATDMDASHKKSAAAHLKHHMKQMDMDTSSMDDMMKEMSAESEMETEGVENVETTSETEKTEELVLSHALIIRIASDSLGFKPVEGAGFADLTEKPRLYAAFCHGDGEQKHTDLFIQDGQDSVHYIVRSDGSVSGGLRESGAWLRQNTIVIRNSNAAEPITLTLRGAGRCSTGVFSKAGGELFMEGTPYNGRYVIAEGKLALAVDEIPHVLNKIMKGEDPVVPPDGQSYLPDALRAKVPENMRYWESSMGKATKLVLCSEWYKSGGWKPAAPNPKSVKMAIVRIEKLAMSGPRLRVFGKAIREGTFNELYFPSGELELAAPAFKGLPIVLEHRFDASEIVGQVVESSWNAVDTSIEFVGEIDDEATAIAITRGTIREVSIGTFVDYVLHTKTPEGESSVEVESRMQASDVLFGLYNKFGADNVSFKISVKNLKPRELSLVMNGACDWESGCGIVRHEVPQ